MPPGLSLIVYAFRFVAVLVLSRGEKCFKVIYLLSRIWNSSTWSSHCNALALIYQRLSWEDTVPLWYPAPHPASFGSVLIGISKRCKILGRCGNVLLSFIVFFWGFPPPMDPPPPEQPWLLFYFVNYLWRKCQLSSKKVGWSTQVLKICLTCSLPLFF